MGKIVGLAVALVAARKCLTGGPADHHRAITSHAITPSLPPSIPATLLTRGLGHVAVTACACELRQ